MSPRILSFEMHLSANSYSLCLTKVTSPKAPRPRTPKLTSSLSGCCIAAVKGAAAVAVPFYYLAYLVTVGFVAFIATVGPETVGAVAAVAAPIGWTAFYDFRLCFAPPVAPTLFACCEVRLTIGLATRGMIIV